MRRAEDVLSATSSQFRNVARELSRHDHFGAAVAEGRGIATRGDHRQELADFANGLRTSARRLQETLGADGLSSEMRKRLERQLSNTSRLADRIESTLRSSTP
jgi:hypothetical protein